MLPVWQRPADRAWPGERWISLDLHIHSTYSQAILNPKIILEMAYQYSLDGIAISDHQEIKGAYEARYWAQQNPALPRVLLSQEVSAGKRFHFLILGESQANIQLNRYNLVRQLESISKEGKIIILAHPWSIAYNDWAQACIKELIMEGILDGVELFNSGLLDHPKKRFSLVREFFEEWVSPYGLGVYGGSDFHGFHKERFIGKGRTYVKIDQEGVQGIYEALKRRRTVAGLFPLESKNYQWPESGESILLGNEPWLGELKSLRSNLQALVAKKRVFNNEEKIFLNGLIELGHFQKVFDLLG